MNNENSRFPLYPKDGPLHLGEEALNLFQRRLIGSPNWREEKTPDVRVNAEGFRCDEFKTNHNERHILFSGCSVTYGVGLLEDEIWAKKLYNKIKQETPLSGFFNLGLSGIGISEIVANIFKYIHNFGKPHSIFVCLPNVQRRYAIDVSDPHLYPQAMPPKIYHAVYKDNKNDEFIDIIQIHAFHYLMFLEMFCKSNNINLYCFSYNDNFATMELDRFYKIETRTLVRNLAQFCTDHPKNKYNLEARDDCNHFGEAYHDYWANFCYNLSTEKS